MYRLVALKCREISKSLNPLLAILNDETFSVGNRDELAPPASFSITTVSEFRSRPMCDLSLLRSRTMTRMAQEPIFLGQTGSRLARETFLIGSAEPHQNLQFFMFFSPLSSQIFFWVDQKKIQGRPKKISCQKIDEELFLELRKK